MKAKWIIYLLVFVAGASAVTISSSKVRVKYRDLTVSKEIENMTRNEQALSDSEEERRLSKLGQNSEKLRAYRNEWESRQMSVASRDNVEETLRNIMMAESVKLSDVPGANQVVDMGSRVFRVDWRVNGEPASVLRFHAVLEERIDYFNIEEATYTVRDASRLELTIQGVVKLPTQQFTATNP